MLDVGAGTGRLLEVARTAGATVFAIDPNPEHSVFFLRRNIEHEIGLLHNGIAFRLEHERLSFAPAAAKTAAKRYRRWCA